MTLRLRLIITVIVSLFLLGNLVPVFAGGCEVVSFSVRKESNKSVSCSGIAIINEKQCADVTVRSLSSVGHQIKDISIKAFFEDQTYEIRSLRPINSGDSHAAIIGAGESYNGKACFKIRPRIVNIECSTN